MIVEATPTKETTDVYTPESQEEVTNSGSQEVATPEVPKQIQKIQSSFDVTLAKIAKMRANADTLSIADHTDTKGYGLVYALRQTIKDQRVEVEKKAKDLKASHLAYNRDVDKAMKLLVDPMKEIENQLSVMEKGYTDKREKIKQEKALAQQRRIETRAKIMRSFGFEYDEVRDAYVFVNQRTGEEASIPFSDIREKSDDEFQPSHDLAKTTFDDEQAALAQIKRDQEAEAQRIRDEQAAAQKVIDDQREQLAAQQREFDRQQAEFAQQQKEAKEQQDNALWQIRLPQLLDAGFVCDKDINSCTNGTERLTKSKVVALNEADFTALVMDAREQVFEKERQRIANEKAAKQAEADKKKADREREKRLAPEKKRYLTYLETVWATPIPTMTEPEMEGLSESFGGELERLITHYRNQIEQL